MSFASQTDISTESFMSINISQPAPWMARASNQVRRAREARPQNIRFTCNPSLARNLPQGSN